MVIRSERLRAVGVWMVSVGGGVSLAGMFAPWVRSGTTSRSSFEMLDLIERLGFARGGPVGLVVRAWPLAPLLVVSAVVLSWWVGGRVAAVVAIVAGLVVGGVGLAVRLAPTTALVGTRWGALITALGGFVMVVGGSVGLAASWSATGDASPASLVPDTPTFEDLP